jgi:hypothetical protein
MNMNEIVEVIRQNFQLADHPFSPDRARDVSPTRPLNVFQAGDRYFARLSGFAAASAEITAFYEKQTVSLLQGDTPAMLILGSAGSGRNTFACFAAYQLKEHCQRARLPIPNLASIADVHDDPSEDYARLLEAARPLVLQHLGANGAAWEVAAAPFGEFKQEAPNRSQIEALFRSPGLMAAPPATLPILVMPVGPIESRNAWWMSAFRELFRPYRVAPIFMTNDSTVADQFEREIDQPRLPVQIGALQAEDAVAFLRHRFSLLRVAADPPTGELFPYLPDAIRSLFTDGTAGQIKYFINLCNAAFNAKASLLYLHSIGARAEKPPLDVTRQDLENAIRDMPRGARRIR